MTVPPKPRTLSTRATIAVVLLALAVVVLLDVLIESRLFSVALTGLTVVLLVFAVRRTVALERWRSYEKYGRREQP